jgi:hypothetical protein
MTEGEVRVQLDRAARMRYGGPDVASPMAWAGGPKGLVNRYPHRSAGRRSEMTRHDGSHDGWRDDVGIGLFGLLVIIVLILTTAALVKYRFFFSKSR